MKIVKIISEWKKRPTYQAQQKHGRLLPGQKMVEAIVEIKGRTYTRHLAVSK